jgi:DNA helicase-2/ATP-dependent DNA helicase PcrA
LRRDGAHIGLASDFTIADNSEQYSIVRQIMLDFGMDTKDGSPKYYVETINRIKNGLGGFDDTLYRLEDVRALYDSKLKQMKICDFNDLILNVLELLRYNSEVREYYNNLFNYILVDEYQDTNALQHQWLKFIGGGEKNKNLKLTCVGDDDQSIYGWRGAEINNILKFTSNYEKAKILKLEKNYRSTENILNVASTLIANNKNRHRKTLYADKSDNDEKVRLIICSDSKQEAISIVEEIENMTDNAYVGDHGNIAVLVRAGYQTRIFEDVFLKYGIPYRIVGTQKFYERKEIKCCLAYLRFVNSQTDFLAFEKIINMPRRGIGPVTVNKIRDFAIDNNLDYLNTLANMCNEGLIKGRTREQLLGFVKSVRGWRDFMTRATPRDLMATILTETGLRESLGDDDEVETRTRMENIEELVKTLEDFSDVKDFLEHVSLMNSSESENVIGAVNMMTIHSAKGLEFDVVFLPNWCEGIFPSPRSLGNKNGLEEERRLAYVAITRAKRRLYISYSRLRYEYGGITAIDMSRFVGELPRESISIINHELDNQQYINYYGRRPTRTNTHFSENYSDGGVRHYKFQDSDSAWESFPGEKISHSRTAKGNNSVSKECTHAKFGRGRIVGEIDNKLKVVFEDFGEKIILREFLNILDLEE